MRKVDRKQDLNPLQSLCFSGRSENQDVATNVAHCTQVHDKGPFGPLVFFMNEKFNKNAKVQHLTNMILRHEERKGLIVKDPFHPI